MIDDLQTQCTAALRRQHQSAAVVAVGAAATDGAEDGAGALTLSFPALAPVPIDGRAVEALLELLNTRDNPSLQVEAAHTLVVLFDRLTTPETRQQALLDEAVPVLMELLRSDDALAKAKAGAVVREVVNNWDGDGDADVRHNVILGPVVRGIMGDDDPAMQLARVDDINWILRIQPDPPIQKVVETGIVPRIVEFMRRDEPPELQKQAAWALLVLARSKIAEGALVDAGAIPVLVGRLRRRTPNGTDKLLAAMGLANITGCGPLCRGLVMENGAMPLLIDLVRRHPNSLQARQAVSVSLARLCLGEPRPSWEVLRPAVPTLARLIAYDDKTTVEYACKALCSVISRPHGAIEEVMGSGVSPRLVELLRHPSPKVQQHAICAVGNIFTGGNPPTQVVLAQNPLPSIRALLASPDSQVKFLACRAIANLAFRGPDRIQDVVDAGIVPSLIQLLGDSKLNVRKQAALAIRNFAEKGTVTQIQVLVGEGCIPPLCGALTVDAPETDVVKWALRGLDRILLAGWKLEQPGDGGADAPSGPRINPMSLLVSSPTSGGMPNLLELRRHHPDEGIRNRACDLLKRYFGIAEDCEWGAANVTAAGTERASESGDGTEPPPKRPRIL